jgi:hypothetical protein
VLPTFWSVVCDYASSVVRRVIEKSAPSPRSVRINTDTRTNGCGVWLPDWLPNGPTHYESQAERSAQSHHACVRSATSAVVRLSPDSGCQGGCHKGGLAAGSVAYRGSGVITELIK